MAKKKQPQIIHTEPISTSFIQLMEDGFARYSKLVIQARALPDVRDGLKPVQRRIIFAMHQDGNTHQKAYRKSAKTVGNVIGNYHPHGDGSVYEAMVNMSQDWKMGVPLIDMQGNNGSIDGDSAAAMRYTESRLSPLASALIDEIGQDTVDFMLNYSDTAQEPIVLPAKFCNLLVNGSTGIASGYATEIPSFNFNEVMKACVYRLINPECSFEEIYEIVPGPDFATGGIIEGQNDIKEFLRTGKGKFVQRCKVTIEESKKLNQIIISEISYGLKKSDLVKRMNDVRINQNLDDILEIRDESDRTGLKIVIDVKPSANTQNLLNILYKETDLQSNYSGNMYGVKDNRPALMGLVEIIDAYLDFRVDVFTRKTKYQLNKKQERLHILEGLIKAISYLDEVIAIIRQSENKKDSKINLIDRFNFSETQAEAIVTLQLYRLSNTDIVELKEEFALLLNEIEHLEAILSNHTILISEISKEFRMLDQTYVIPRKTKIKDEVKEIVIDKQALITPEEVMVSVSKDGYLKKSSLRSYSSSNQFYSSIKQDDRLIAQAQAYNTSYLLCFTKAGNYFTIQINDIAESKWKDIGQHYSSMIANASNEAIVAAIVVSDFQTDSAITLATSHGKIKQTIIKDFETSRINRLYKAIKLSKGDELIGGYLTLLDDKEIFLLTQNGMITRYQLNQIPIQGLSAAGVKSMNLQQDDVIVDGGVLRNQSQLIILCEDGQAKRIKLDEINQTGRPARGVLVAKKNKSNPNIISQAYVGDINDVLAIYTIENEQTFIKDVKLMTTSQTYSKVFESGAHFVKPLEFSFIETKSVETTISNKQEQVSFDLD